MELRQNEISSKNWILSWGHLWIASLVFRVWRKTLLFRRSGSVIVTYTITSSSPVTQAEVDAVVQNNLAYSCTIIDGTLNVDYQLVAECTGDFLTHFNHYRWVPIDPNVDKKNSQFIQKNHGEKFLSLLFNFMLNLKFAWFKGFFLGITFFELSGRHLYGVLSSGLQCRLCVQPLWGQWVLSQKWELTLFSVDFWSNKRNLGWSNQSQGCFTVVKKRSGGLWTWEQDLIWLGERA